MKPSFNKHTAAYSLLSAAVIALAVWGGVQTAHRRRLATELENQYNRAFFELTGYVDDIATSLDKSMLAVTPAQLASISSDLYRKASAAEACMGQLPISDVNMENTSKFLAQVGDYTYVLSQNMINDEKITDEQYEKLSSLARYAGDLNTSLSKMRRGVYDGSISLSRNIGAATVLAAEDMTSGMESVEKSFEDYPALIYDGPFSEHIQNARPLMLENTTEISRDEAQRRAAGFIGAEVTDLRFESESMNTNMDAFTFSLADKDHEQFISVTKYGGYVLYMLDNKAAGKETVSFEDAEKKALDFLEAHGYTSMKPSYYDKADGIATINFAYRQDNIVCYSDLIKVRVALDTGAIVGFEAKGYLMCHAHRDVDPPKISSASALSRISKRLNVTGTQLAIIPKDSMKEVLCWEISGRANDKNFIIYINADNGREEKILLLLESENGILTV